MAGKTGNSGVPVNPGITVAVLASREAARRRIAAALAAGGIEALAGRTGDELEQNLAEAKLGALVIACASTAVNAKRLILDLRRRFPTIPAVAVIRGGEKSRLVRAALEANVEGVVLSERIGDALIPTVRAVSAGQVVVPQSEYRRTQPIVLSHREREVLRLAVEGMTNDAIGRTLYISRSTVKSHLTSAFAKLSVRSRSEAAVVLLDPDEPVSRQVFGTRVAAESELAGLAVAGSTG
jgi:DNA-binding NarL/FixJ family response regulator